VSRQAWLSPRRVAVSIPAASMQSQVFVIRKSHQIFMLKRAMKLLAGYMMNAMKNLISPNNLIWVGIAFVTLGFVLPFLTVLGVFESTFLLALVTFLLQLGGIIIGVIVTAEKAMEGRRKYQNRKKKEEKDEQESETGWME